MMCWAVPGTVSVPCQVAVAAPGTSRGNRDSPKYRP